MAAPTPLRLAGIVGVCFFWTSVIVAGALTPGYSHLRQVVSELGAIGAPHAWIVNWFGIVPFAVGIALTGIWLVATYRPGPVAWLAGATVVIAGLGFAAAGAMPCDVGCRPSRLPSAAVHAMGAGVGFLLLPLGSLIFGLRAFWSRRHRWLHWFSLLSAAGMVGSLPRFLRSLEGSGDTTGLWQRTALFFISLWISGISWHMYRLSGAVWPTAGSAE